MLPSPPRFFSHAIVYALVTTLVVLSGASNAHAQSSKVGAILEGIVVDSRGAVVPDVEVSVGNTATGQMRVVTTDAQGAFRAAELPAGTYEVRVARAGLATYRNTGVEIPHPRPVLVLCEDARFQGALFSCSRDSRLCSPLPHTGLTAILKHACRFHSSVRTAATLCIIA